MEKQGVGRGFKSSTELFYKNHYFYNKPTIQVTITSYLEEEVEIRPRPIIEEQLQSIYASKHVKKEELQQYVVEK